MGTTAGGGAVAKTFLLTNECPAVQTGIARMMGEITRRYPRGELLVSTGQHRDSQDSDVRFSGAVIDRLPVPSKALRNLAGLLFWSRRVASLARQHKPRFAWCDSIRPCTYPGKWMHERVGTRQGACPAPGPPVAPPPSGRAPRPGPSGASWRSIRSPIACAWSRSEPTRS